MTGWEPIARGGGMPYDRLDSGKWTRSLMPSGAAVELLRRLDWTPCGEWLECPAEGMRMPLELLRRTDGI